MDQVAEKVEKLALLMEQVAEKVEKLVKDFEERLCQALLCYINSIQKYGEPSKVTTTSADTEKSYSLHRINSLVQDAIHVLESLQFELDLQAPQLTDFCEVEKAQCLANAWKNQIQRNKAGITSAMGCMPESYQRTRQLLVQELERSEIICRRLLEESTSLLQKAESKYKDYSWSLAWTRGLLSKMQRQDVFDKVLLMVGFLLFSLSVLYVVSRRLG